MHVLCILEIKPLFVGKSFDSRKLRVFKSTTGILRQHIKALLFDPTTPKLAQPSITTMSRKPSKQHQKVKINITASNNTMEIFKQFKDKYDVSSDESSSDTVIMC